MIFQHLDGGLHFTIGASIPNEKVTFAMVKPDAMPKLNEILAEIHGEGYAIIWSSILFMDKEMAEEFYAEHKGKPFYDKLIIHMSYKYVFPMIIASPFAVTSFRKLIGSTNPQEAERDTLRARYGTIMPANALHASDSIESVQRELKIVLNWLK